MDGRVKCLGEAPGERYAAYHGDCVDVVRQLPDASVGFSVYSPPFSNLFVYSDSAADMGNAGSDGEFLEHYGYLLAELARVTKPGRLSAVHCSDLPLTKWKDGVIGIKDLSGDIIRALGTLGRDESVQAQAHDAYTALQQQSRPIDPNVIPALVSILAFTGDAARYEEFAGRFRHAATPQEERRYLFSLAAFRAPDLLERTLAKTLTDEIRTQDAPFLVSSLLHNVYIRDKAWEFVKTNWERMDKLFPKSGLRRMCGGITGLSTPELERDVRDFFASRKIDLGGKTLEQYLEQLRIAVEFRTRDREAIRAVLARKMT